MDSAMYAVIQTGGKQYRVSEGDKLRVEKLVGDVGSEIVFEDVLMLGGDAVTIGKPTVAGASVKAEIVAQDRAKKIIVFKMHRRKRYQRKYGHRQPYTELRITGISA
jgi:large subunit ribosomal protein L21